MTTVGKILVVLHVVLSVLFMAFAGAVYTSQTNWKKYGEAQAKLLKDANDKLKNQQAEFEKERTDAAAKATAQADQITKLTGEKTALNTQVTALDADNKRLTVALDGQRDLAALNGVEAEERKKEADLQREQNAISFKTREELIAKLQKVEDERFALELQLQQLTEKHEKILGDYKTVRNFLASKELPTDPKLMIAQVTPPPPLEGKITQYRKEAKGGIEYVEISLGSDEGLYKGHKLTAHNKDGKYLGMIRLTNVYPDKAVGIVIKEQKAKNVTIQEGDYVTTKL